MALSEPSTLALHRLVAQHTDESHPDISALTAIGSERQLAKDETLLDAGQEARLAGIVVEGVMGEFYVGADGKRKAKWLAGAGEVVGSMEDLVRKGPAHATIQALTPALVLCLPYAKLRSMALEQPAWSRFFIVMMEQLYRRKSEREYTLLMLKAEDRYGWFRKHHGLMESKLPQEIIASYLGITPVHLSRVRRSSGPR